MLSGIPSKNKTPILEEFAAQITEQVHLHINGCHWPVYHCLFFKQVCNQCFFTPVLCQYPSKPHTAKGKRLSAACQRYHPHGQAGRSNLFREYAAAIAR